MMKYIVFHTDQELSPEGFSALTNTRYLGDPETGEIIGKGGELKNLTVETGGGKTIIAGNPLLFTKGYVLETLSLQEIKEAIEEVEDTLHLPLRQASVDVLRIGSDLIVEEPARKYLDLCGDAPGYERSWDEGGKFTQELCKYERWDQTLLLYDRSRALAAVVEEVVLEETLGRIVTPEEIAEIEEKITPEVMAKFKEIMTPEGMAEIREIATPEPFRKKNVLHCGVRLIIWQLEAQLKRPVTVADLYDPALERKLSSMWAEGFLNITKDQKTAPAKSMARELDSKIRQAAETMSGSSTRLPRAA